MLLVQVPYPPPSMRSMPELILASGAHFQPVFSNFYPNPNFWDSEFLIPNFHSPILSPSFCVNCVDPRVNILTPKALSWYRPGGPIFIKFGNHHHDDGTRTKPALGGDPRGVLEGMVLPLLFVPFWPFHSVCFPPCFFLTSVRPYFPSMLFRTFQTKMDSPFLFFGPNSTHVPNLLARPPPQTSMWNWFWAYFLFFEFIELNGEWMFGPPSPAIRGRVPRTPPSGRHLVLNLAAICICLWLLWLWLWLSHREFKPFFSVAIAAIFSCSGYLKNTIFFCSQYLKTTFFNTFFPAFLHDFFPVRLQMFSANMHGAAVGAPGVGGYPYQPYQNVGFGAYGLAPPPPMVHNAGYPPRVFPHPPNPRTQNRGAGNYVAAGHGKGRGKGNGGKGAGGRGGAGGVITPRVTPPGQPIGQGLATTAVTAKWPNSMIYWRPKGTKLGYVPRVRFPWIA